MRLTEEQKRAVKNGVIVHLRKEGLDCVVIRADLYERVAQILGYDQRVCDDGTRGREEPSGGAGRQNETTVVAVEPWTEEQNLRRCELIDKAFGEAISEDEQLELDRLQRRFHNYLDDIAPPPIVGARRLHHQLLEKKRKRERWD
jgi:hypothetical protein